MARRRARREHLTDDEIETIVLAAIALRNAMGSCSVHLRPFNETYTLFHDQITQLDAMMEKITGLTIDYRARDLGLLPAKN